MLRDHGSREKYYYDFIGHNYRMAAFQGAVLGVKADYIHEWNDNRRRAAEKYRQLLKDTPLELPVETGDARHVYHLYAAHTPKRDDLRAFLSERDIASGLHYPYPLHTQKAYAYLGYEEGGFPGIGMEQRKQHHASHLSGYNSGTAGRSCGRNKGVLLSRKLT